jgi:hypothetical protein
MLKKSLMAVVLGAAVLAGAAPAHAAVVPTAKPVGGCALLGSAGAATFLGGPASIIHETNQKGHGPTTLIRGCVYEGGDQTLGYNVSTYSTVGMAKTVFSEMSTATQESTDSVFLQASDNVKIKGMPGFARIHRLIPGAAETPPAKEFLYQLVVRKGATILVEDYAANDLDSMPRMYATARTIVARM